MNVEYYVAVLCTLRINKMKIKNATLNLSDYLVQVFSEGIILIEGFTQTHIS